MINISTPLFENEIKKPSNQYNLIDINDGLNTKLLENADNTILQNGTKINSKYLNKIRNDLNLLSEVNDRTRWYVQMNNKAGSNWEMEYQALGFYQITIDRTPLPGRKHWTQIRILIESSIKKILLKYTVAYVNQRNGHPSKTNDIDVPGKVIKKKWRYANSNVTNNIYSDISEIIDIDGGGSIVLNNMFGELTPSFNLRIEVIE